VNQRTQRAQRVLIFTIQRRRALRGVGYEPEAAGVPNTRQRLWDTKAPPTSALRDYGLASQARETDGDGAPSLPIWKGARCVDLKTNR